MADETEKQAEDTKEQATKKFQWWYIPLILFAIMGLFFFIEKVGFIAWEKGEWFSKEVVEPTTEVVEPTTEVVEPTTEVVEPTAEVVEPTFEHIDYIVWDNVAEEFPHLEAHIVFAHDDYGKSQYFLACSPEEIRESFDLQKEWGIYFNLFTGEASTTLIHKLIEDNLNEENIGKAMGIENWVLQPPTVVDCSN